MDLRLVGNRRLITEIPGTSLHYLYTKQSEESHTTHSPHSKSVFKHSSLKPMREFESFEYELPVLA